MGIYLYPWIGLGDCGAWSIRGNGFGHIIWTKVMGGVLNRVGGLGAGFRGQWGARRCSLTRGVCLGGRVHFVCRNRTLI